MVRHRGGHRSEHPSGPRGPPDQLPGGRDRVPPDPRFDVRLPAAGPLERRRPQATYAEARSAVEPLPSRTDAAAEDDVLVPPAAQRCPPRIRRIQVLRGAVARLRAKPLCDLASMARANAPG